MTAFTPPREADTMTSRITFAGHPIHWDTDTTQHYYLVTPALVHRLRMIFNRAARMRHRQRRRLARR